MGTVKRNTQDVADAVRQIAAAQPGAVIMISAYSACAAFIRQAKSSGMRETTFLNVSFVGSKSLATDLWLDGRGVIVSQVVPFPWGRAVPVVKEYQQLSEKAGHTDYNFSAMEGFLSAKVAVEGLRRAGRNLTREGYIAALEKIRSKGSTDDQVAMSASSHSPSGYDSVAAASISAELSSPSTDAVGQRSRRRRVLLPGPHPRSQTRAGC